MWRRIPEDVGLAFQGAPPPRFPVPPGAVAFFGRLFLQHLGQVDAEIMEAYVGGSADESDAASDGRSGDNDDDDGIGGEGSDD